MNFWKTVIIFTVIIENNSVLKFVLHQNHHNSSGSQKIAAKPKNDSVVPQSRHGARVIASLSQLELKKFINYLLNSNRK